MKSSDGDTGLSTARLDVVAQLARTASAPMTPLQRMVGLQLVNERVAARGRRRAPWKPWMVVSLLGAAAVTGAVVVGSSSFFQTAGPETGALAYKIEGGTVGDGGYIRSFDPAGSLLRFGEGTELRLMAGARGRLSSVDDKGARFAIEEGEAEVKVTPLPGARWLVDAGPFLITVRGTVFTAAWDGATERLDIRMKKGLVSVTGPVADGVMAVRAGQHLSINMRKKEILLREIDGPEARSDAPSQTPSADAFAPASSRIPGTRPAPMGSARTALASGSRSWAAALAAGDLDLILGDAETRGLRRSLWETSSEDLAALADAARYRRRDDIARQALIAERERFPRSSRARDSAFLLGRLEESKADAESSARALKWYDLYLKEAPSGAYSSEALGRKMTATERLRGVSAAREVADQYLRRFPRGTYAGAARALRETP